MTKHQGYGQVVEHLPSKVEDLSSNPNVAKKNSYFGAFQIFGLLIKDAKPYAEKLEMAK
jgi:hypothetical protein